MIYHLFFKILSLAADWLEGDLPNRLQWVEQVQQLYVQITFSIVGCISKVLFCCCVAWLMGIPLLKAKQVLQSPLKKPIFRINVDFIKLQSKKYVENRADKGTRIQLIFTYSGASWYQVGRSARQRNCQCSGQTWIKNNQRQVNMIRQVFKLNYQKYVDCKTEKRLLYLRRRKSVIIGLNRKEMSYINIIVFNHLEVSLP